MSPVSLIIPALNEAESIGKVLAEIPPQITQVIVVDNGSDDATATIANETGATVIHEPRRGYGAACMAGIAAANGELLAFMDADYADFAADLPSVISPVANDGIDLVIGARAAGGRPLHQRLGNRFICACIAMRYGARFADLGPMRCIRRETLARLDMRDRDYGWTLEMQLKAVRRGLRVVEVPVRYRPRLGKSKISGTVRGSAAAAVKMGYWLLLTP